MSSLSSSKQGDPPRDFATTDPRWAALLAREPHAHAPFVYAVRTTGIYCRVGCKARTPRRKNVEFYRDAKAAERAGFRPCKRCHPNQEVRDAPQLRTVERLCRMIEASAALPRLDGLSRNARMSVHHLHRVFKAATGITPRDYAHACRARRLRTELRRAGTVTAAMYDAGYISSGRFYEASNQILGMTPTSYRSGGAGEQIQFAVESCALGSILVAATARGVCAVSLGDDRRLLLDELGRLFPKAELQRGGVHFDTLVAKVVAAVESPSRGLDLPLDIRGTAFQQRVWRALRDVPPGATVTYSSLARRLGAPNATRAVARACATNVIAVAIPCHRVVRQDGNLAGYRWGLERKRALLELEEAKKPRRGSVASTRTKSAR
ncbi:MAG: bifunctional DNA-binding transcriptional regulator/O6-methylguanine-DNA methyltransferase Ada [Polyangiaceae bacterium]